MLKTWDKWLRYAFTSADCENQSGRLRYNAEFKAKEFVWKTLTLKQAKTQNITKNPSLGLERLGVVPIWRVLACSAHGSRFRAKKRRKEARTPSAGVHTQ